MPKQTGSYRAHIYWLGFAGAVALIAAYLASNSVFLNKEVKKYNRNRSTGERLNLALNKILRTFVKKDESLRASARLAFASLPNKHDPIKN